MSKKREVTLTRSSFSPEDQEELLQRTIIQWQEQGIAAIWRATWELTVLSYALRGSDIRGQSMIKSHEQLIAAPWLAQDLEPE